MVINTGREQLKINLKALTEGWRNLMIWNQRNRWRSVKAKQNEKPLKSNYKKRKISMVIGKFFSATFIQPDLTHYEWHLFNFLLSFQPQNSYGFWYGYWYPFYFNIADMVIELLLGNGEMLLHIYVQVETSSGARSWNTSYPGCMGTYFVCHPCG